MGFESENKPNVGPYCDHIFHLQYRLALQSGFSSLFFWHSSESFLWLVRSKSQAHQLIPLFHVSLLQPWAARMPTSQLGLGQNSARLQRAQSSMQQQSASLHHDKPAWFFISSVWKQIWHVDFNVTLRRSCSRFSESIMPLCKEWLWSLQKVSLCHACQSHFLSNLITHCRFLAAVSQLSHDCLMAAWCRLGCWQRSDWSLLFVAFLSNYFPF